MNEIQAIATTISLSVIKNQEFQSQTAIAIGRGGQLKNGETCNGTSGVWFQPFSGASDMVSLIHLRWLNSDILCVIEDTKLADESSLKTRGKVGTNPKRDG